MIKWGNEGKWLRILSLSHHLSMCLSATQPSVVILSLNYCAQHIPVNHTHASMQRPTMQNLAPCITSQYEEQHCYTGLITALTWISFNLRDHICLVDCTNNISVTSKITCTEHHLQPEQSCQMRNCFCCAPFFWCPTLTENSALSFAELSRTNESHS